MNDFRKVLYSIFKRQQAVVITIEDIYMRTVGLKLDNTEFSATIAKIIRKYQDLPLTLIKQIVINNDYLFKCDIIHASGIRTILQFKEDLAKEGIRSYVCIEDKPTTDEYLNNLLVSYKQTEEQVEAEMDSEALLNDDPGLSL